MGIYSLGRERKCLFGRDTTNYIDVARQTIIEEGGNTKISRGKASYSYFFTINGNSGGICKDFFLGTLAISQKKKGLQ